MRTRLVKSISDKQMEGGEGGGVLICFQEARGSSIFLL